MSLIKLAKINQRDIDNYNKAYKQKAGKSGIVAGLIGASAGVGGAYGLSKVMKTSIPVSELVLSGSLGWLGGRLANHVRVRNKISKQISSKIAK